ncbi:MAG: PIN domain-containing protein [Nanoarchaeota archaeon]
MKVVVDANIFLSALISPGGKTCELIFSNELSLAAPEYLFEEFTRHQAEILKKSRLSKAEFAVALSLISSQIQFIPYAEFKDKIHQAEQITPDPNDTEYLALALRLKCPIWSNDKALKKQDAVKIFSTQEILREF